MLSGLSVEGLPKHVAIIMDGNGRWAKARLRNRVFGHEEGVNSVREVVRCCSKLNIPYLTLYAFSKENWQRPAAEVRALWMLLKRFLRAELPELVEKQVRLRHLGDREGMPDDVLRELDHIVRETADFDHMDMYLAINYGGRQELAVAAARLAAAVRDGLVREEDITPDTLSGYMYRPDVPFPDLVIRTGGEQRISNFLIWQIAYAELYFTPVFWPDFREAEFVEALRDFQLRERRFGKTSEQVVSKIRRAG
jgi:undecaprenyl diphosphate synthase